MGRGRSGPGGRQCWPRLRESSQSPPAASGRASQRSACCQLSREPSNGDASTQCSAVVRRPNELSSSVYHKPSSTAITPTAHGHTHRCSRRPQDAAGSARRRMWEPPAISALQWIMECGLVAVSVALLEDCRNFSRLKEAVRLSCRRLASNNQRDGPWRQCTEIALHKPNAGIPTGLGAPHLGYRWCKGSK